MSRSLEYTGHPGFGCCSRETAVLRCSDCINLPPKCVLISNGGNEADWRVVVQVKKEKHDRISKQSNPYQSTDMEAECRPPPPKQCQTTSTHLLLGCSVLRVASEKRASVEMRLVHHPLQLWRHRPERSWLLGVDFPFFSTMVLFENRIRFPGFPEVF